MDLLEYLQNAEVRLGDHLNKIHRAVQRDNIVEYPFRLPAQGKTDGTGALETQLQGALPSGGKSLVIARLILLADGFTPTNPFIGAVGANGCWLGVFHGRGQNLGAMDDFLPYNNQPLLLPAVASYSGRNALVFQRNDDIWFGLHNGPANTNITFIAIGWVTSFGKETE